LDKLEEILQKYRDRKFVVIEPGGNNGDRLIYLGLEKKLREMGINYHILRYKEKKGNAALYKTYVLWKTFTKTLTFLTHSNYALTAIDIVDKKFHEHAFEAIVPRNARAHMSADVILIHGGANMNDLWSHGIRLLKNVIQQNPDNIVIVAPQTYWFYRTKFSKLFSGTKQDIYLFSREKYSYSLLKSMNLPENIHVLLSPDAVFYLSRDDFHPLTGTYDLVCFRNDPESVIFSLKSDYPQKLIEELKLSNRAVHVEDVPVLCSFEEFIKLIEGSNRVYTDRLHVAIPAAILGKDTVLYSNSYYKNKGVFEFSLKAHFPNLKFVDIAKNSEVILKKMRYRIIQRKIFGH
jgi:exopolysaccharide biosynthesis predicted pyruvyltransferase EpsI